MLSWKRCARKDFCVLQKKVVGFYSWFSLCKAGHLPFSLRRKPFNWKISNYSILSKIFQNHTNWRINAQLCEHSIQKFTSFGIFRYKKLLYQLFMFLHKFMFNKYVSLLLDYPQSSYTWMHIFLCVCCKWCLISDD